MGAEWAQRADVDTLAWSGTVRAANAWRVVPHLRRMSIKDLWQYSQGRGVRVAILDTGAANVRGLIGERVVQLTPEWVETKRLDRWGHGTRCASLIGSDLPEAPGVAPGATVAMVNIANRQGRPNYGAIEYALSHVPDWVDVVSCSFTCQTAKEPLKDAVRFLWSSGVPVIASAGNNNAKPTTFPEQTPSAITVAALHAGDAAPRVAKRGPWIDVATRTDQLTFLTKDHGVVQHALGRSSEACALVAGLTALMLGLAATPSERRSLGQAMGNLLVASGRRSRKAIAATSVVAPTQLLRFCFDHIEYFRGYSV